MKFVHFSDLHIGNHKFIPLDDFLKVFQNVYKTAIKYECKDIVFSGDFFDKRNTPRYIYDSVIKSLVKLDQVRWYIGVGNHDRDKEGHSLNIFNILKEKIPHVEVLELPTIINIDQYRIKVLHGVTRNSIMDNGTEAHQSSIDIQNSELVDGCNYYALGHLHKHQRISASKFGYYAGSPLQLSFGEAEDKKGWLVIDLVEKKKIFVENKKCTTFENILVEIDEDGNPKFSNEELPENCFVKFIVVGNASHVTNFKTKLAPRIARHRKYFVEPIINNNYKAKTIEQITQSSSIEDDIVNYVNELELGSSIDREKLINILFSYVRKAKEK